MYHVFGSFKSTSLTFNGNISDVPLKYSIIYKSIRFLSSRHAVTSCSVFPSNQWVLKRKLLRFGILSEWGDQMDWIECTCEYEITWR